MTGSCVGGQTLGLGLVGSAFLVAAAAAAVSSAPPPPELASEVAAAASEAKELFSMAIEGLCTFFTQILIS